MEFETTPRGFNIYGTVIDTRGCTIRVQKSSAATRDCVWIFTEDTKKVYDDGNPAPHLTVDQAKELIAALTNFVEDMKVNGLEEEMDDDETVAVFKSV